jgi:hypothetical protein
MPPAPIPQELLQPNTRLGWWVGLLVGSLSVGVVAALALAPGNGGAVSAVSASADTLALLPEPTAPSTPLYSGGVRRTLTITNRTQTDSLASMLGIPADSILDPNNGLQPVGAIVGSWPTNRVNVLVRDTFRTRAATTVSHLADSLGLTEASLRLVNSFSATGQVQRGKLIVVPYSNPTGPQ